MMDNVYAVCQIGYEYDDERYAETRCEASTPTGSAYRSKAKAEAQATKLNIKELREIDLAEYTDDMEDLFSYWDNETNKRIDHDIGEYGFHDIEDVSEYIKKASDDDLAELAKLMSIKFFEVREIKLVD